MVKLKEITIVAPTPEHLDYIAANMRRADLDELAALSDRTPRESIGDMVAGQKFVALNAAGTPFAVFGVWEIPAQCGVLWMLGTDAVADHKREMLIFGKMIIQDWLREYACLVNTVHAANKPAIRMLRKWGFTILPAVNLGRDGSLFHPFYMRGQ